MDRNARLVLALELLRQGLPIEDIARRLPNHKHAGGQELGVGANVARRILKDSLRYLAAHAERNLRPAWLPDHLWPPPEVRRQLEATATDRRLDRHLAPLEAWLREGGRGAPGSRRRPSRGASDEDRDHDPPAAAD